MKKAMKNKSAWLYPTFGSILIGAIFPILASATLKSIPPFLTLTLTFITAAIVLGIILTIQGKI
jgi:VIT1/CCC1 family predicted Fe2+/Mn2+ transporter